MYSPLNCIKPKYSRLQDFQSDLSGIKEELEYLKNPYLTLDAYHKIDNKKFHLSQITQDSKILFSIAQKKLKQAEEVLHFDIATTQVVNIRGFLVDLLKLTRHIILTKTSNNVNNLKQGVEIFEKSILQPIEFSNSSLTKILGAKQDPITDYLHLYLDVSWLLLTFQPHKLPATISQLTYLSLKNFEKHKPLFTCDCFQSMWLRIQLFCELKNLDFWTTYNANFDLYSEDFTISHLNLVAELQQHNSDGVFIGPQSMRITENFDYLNTKWTGLLKTNPSDTKFKEYLKTINSLLTLWLENSKLDLIYSTWDYIYKQIETFEIKTNLIETSQMIHHQDNTSFEIFLSILSRHLERHPGHWNKFRGRIYTRFSNSKIGKLSDNGIFNLSLLFLCICQVSFNEIVGKLTELLEAVPNDKQNSITIWNIYIAVIQITLQNNNSIENCSKNFLKILHEASQSRNNFHLLTLFASHLPALISSSENLNLHQKSLFSSWIEPYTKSCQYSDLSQFLNSIILITERLHQNGAWYEYKGQFMSWVLPSVKRLAVGQCPAVVGTLGALIGGNSVSNFFLSENVCPSVCVNFFLGLSKRLENEESEAFIVRAWFQCGLIGEDNVELTKAVFALPTMLSFKENENLVGFIEKLGTSGEVELSKTCFGNLDRFIHKHLQNINASQHIYTYMAVIFSSCGRLIYSRSSTCLLSKFIDILLLPSDVLRGLKPHNLKPIEKTWHLYVAAIYNLSSSDPYLDRVLKDLIVRYIPHFLTKPHPLTKILNNPILAAFALTKINKEFFLQGQSRSNEDQTSKALTTLNTLLEDSSNLTTLKLLTEHSLPALLEVYMFKPQKVLVIDFIKALIKTPHYKSNSLNALIDNSLLEVTRKHLPFNTSNYFQMCCVLARILTADLRRVLGGIKNEIAVVEAKRGQGFDNSLRQGFDKLHRLLG